MSATNSFAGDRLVDANIGTDGTCESFLAKDNINAVSFGDLPQGTLAATCSWTVNYLFGKELVEADIKFNKVDHSWTTTPGSSSCSGQYDIQSVSTHEFGHVFGLRHVNIAEADHPDLTMSPASNGPCQASERTLGLGDILGLEESY